VISPKRNSGFTLAELVVATTITVLVSGSTVAILRSMSVARQRANHQMSLQQEARAAVNAIATALRNAYRLGGEQGVLEGTSVRLEQMPADRLRFFTISRPEVRQEQPESDMKECEFFLSEPTDESPGALMRRIDPTWNEQPDEGGVVHCVAENIVGLEFAYHDGTGWLDEWSPDIKDWPLAIRIRLAVLGKAKPPKLWTASRVVDFPRRPKPKEQENK